MKWLYSLLRGTGHEIIAIRALKQFAFQDLEATCHEHD